MNKFKKDVDVSNKENEVPNVVYTIEEKEVKKMQIDHNLFVRVLQSPDDMYLDIRKYYKGYPTKQGIKFRYSIFEKLKELF